MHKNVYVRKYIQINVAYHLYIHHSHLSRVDFTTQLLSYSEYCTTRLNYTSQPNTRRGTDHLNSTTQLLSYSEYLWRLHTIFTLFTLPHYYFSIKKKNQKNRKINFKTTTIKSIKVFETWNDGQ